MTIGYMCMIDFEDELGEASGGNTVYPSVEDLKRHHDAWESCGIVEVKVTRVREVAPQNLRLERLTKKDDHLNLPLDQYCTGFEP
jgi:hypothetical protein